MAGKLLGRNEPCWCGSGTKFKKCHYRRETEPEANFFETVNSIHKSAKKGRCLHPDSGGGNCGARAIASHTVQRSGGLAAIAEEGHLLTTFLDAHDLRLSNGSPEPKKIGINIASTFPGFCNKHDTELFSPIELDSLALSQETAFLFHYRAVCLELVRKRHVVEKTVPALRKADAGQPLLRQFQIQKLVNGYSQGATAGLSDLEKVKAELDDKLTNGDWSGIHYVAIEFDSNLPVTSTFAIQPERDWQGNKLQDLSDMTVRPEEISVAITSYEQKGHVIFVWVGNAMGISRAFVDSFMALPKSDWASVLVESCFELAENTQIRPSWWASLGDAVRKQLCDKILSGTPHAARRPDGLQGTISLDPSPKVIRIIDSSQ